MELPEQPIHKEDRMGNQLESKEGLQSVIQELRETAEKFRTLEDEADIALTNKDVEGRKQKLRERAQLLVDLPDRLSDVLERVDLETKQEVRSNVSYFATAAQEALESEGEGLFSLAALLTHKGGMAGDKNDLEKLIDSLENR